jgi:hypothetical protein
MNKQELKEFIKGIVRENLEERNYSQLLNEVSPPGAERKIMHIKASLRKSHPNWSKDKIIGVAIGKAWKDEKSDKADKADETVTEAGKVKPAGIPKFGKDTVKPAGKPVPTISTDKKPVGVPPGTLSKLNPKIVKKLDEAGPQYKVAGNTQARCSKCNHALNVQSDPKLTEASYKVVAPKSATDTKEDKARKIQTEPKVNEIVAKIINKHAKGTKKLKETAYKTQGPSLKTFDDSPQLPDAVNNPKNA